MPAFLIYGTFMRGQPGHTNLDGAELLAAVETAPRYRLFEVDGALHLQTMNYWNDARRQNDLVIGGTPILRFPSIAFRVDIETVEAQLRRAGIAFGLIKAA